MSMRLLPQLAALLLGAATAFLVACGDDNLIPASDASRVQNALNEVRADYRAGRCQAAEAAVAKARGALLNLPDSVDSRLRDRLRSGLAKLGEEVPATCGQSQTQIQETQTQTQETQTDTESTDTDTDTESTETETTESTETETQPTESTGTTTQGTTTGGTTTGDDTGGTSTPGEG
jgi:Ran GTPase-activating protein (RanGAP) involved in mRNA processing and transport